MIKRIVVFLLVMSMQLIFSSAYAGFSLGSGNFRWQEVKTYASSGAASLGCSLELRELNNSAYTTYSNKICRYSRDLGGYQASARMRSTSIDATVYSTTLHMEYQGSRADHVSETESMAKSRCEQEFTLVNPFTQNGGSSTFSHNCTKGDDARSSYYARWSDSNPSGILRKFRYKPIGLPKITINSPAQGGSSELGDAVLFSATGSDPLKGNVASSIRWSSSKQGHLGSGGNFSLTNLVAGSHQIFANLTVDGYDAATVTRTFTINDIRLSNPQAVLKTPHEAYLAVPLSIATATINGENHKNSVTWTSSIDGTLGVGGAISPNLSAGTHIITASLSKDGNGKSTQTTVTIVEDYPHLKVDEPQSGRILDIDEVISFKADVTFRGAPSSNASILWTSSLDGALGSSDQFTKSGLTEGQHEITVSATENGEVSTKIIYLTIYDSEKNLGDENDGQCMGGNPINLITGNKYHEELDFSTSTELPIFVKRSYNSASKYKGLFGYGWSSNIEERVEHDETAQQAEVVKSTGAVQRFDLSEGVWIDDSSDEGTLDKLTNGWRYTKYDGTVKTYDEKGNILSIVAQNKLSLEYNYINGNLSSITDAYGQSISFAYNSDGFVESFTDPDGFVYIFDYLNDNLVSITYPDLTPQDISDNPIKKYHYENASFPHALTGLTDEEGIRFADWTYDEYGRANSSAHHNGVEEFSIVYNPDGTVTTTNALNKQTTYHYKSVKGLLKVTDVEGHQSAHCAAASTKTTYDPETGFADSKTDWRGNQTLLEHNRYGQLTSSTIVDTGIGWSETPINERVTITTEYNASRLPELTTKPGRTIEWKYTANGRLERFTQTDTTTHAEPYSTNGETRITEYNYTFYEGTNLIHTVDIDGPRRDKIDVLSKEFDEEGNLVEVRNALGHVTRYQNHTARGLPQKVIDVNGLVTDLEYNARGWLTKKTALSSKGDSVTLYNYYDNGLLKTNTLPDGSSLTYKYNGARQLKEIVNNSGERKIFSPNVLNGDWKDLTYADAGGSETYHRFRKFDELGRVRLETTNAGHHIDYDYDPDGNATLITEDIVYGQDSQVRLTLSKFDAQNRLRAKTSDDQPVVTYDYDLAGNLIEIKVTSADNQITEYVYNGFGEVIYEDSPATGTKTIYRDEAGNIVREINSDSQEVERKYDELNRLKRVIYRESASENVDYEYDGVGVNGIGRLTSVSDESGSKNFEYDDQGYLERVNYSIVGESYAIDYDFDKAGKLIQVVYPSGRSITYGYDSQGRPNHIDAGSKGTLVNEVDYYPFGQFKEIEYGSGLRREIKLDDTYRPAHLTHHWLSQSEKIVYDFDTADRIRAQSRSLEFGATARMLEAKSFEYDHADRLEKSEWRKINGVSQTDEFIHYDYDDFGNRITKQQKSALNGINRHWSYGVNSTNNQITSQSVAQDGSSFELTHEYAYKPAGQTSSDGELSWTYNHAQRMASVTNSENLTTEYLYNAAGQRVEKKSGSEITHFHYDLGGQLIAETDSSGTIIREYFYLGSMPVAMVTGDSVYEDVPSSSTELVGNDRVRMDAGEGETTEILQRAMGDTEISGQLVSVSSKSSGKEEVGLTIREQQDGASGTRVDVSLAVVHGSDVSMITVKTPEGKIVPIPMFFDTTSDPSMKVDITYSGGTTEQLVLTPKGEYVKLEREGQQINIYSSGNGSDWSILKTISVPMLDEVYIGAQASNATVDIETSYKTANDNLFYLHTDHLNSVYAVSSNLSRNVVWQRNDFESGASPFGMDIIADGGKLHSGVFEMPLRFPGQYFDRETGKNFNYFRDYDPLTGRYIESDPIGLTAGLNTYGYAGSNPLSNLDVYGLWWDGIGLNFTFITDGEGTSTSFSLASDGDGLYCVVTHQKISGTGYFYAGGGEAAFGSGELMPDDTKLLESSTSRDYMRGVLGGVTSPIKVKGVFGFAGGLSTSGGEVSGATARRGPGVGYFVGDVNYQETYKIKLLPDYRLWE